MTCLHLAAERGDLDMVEVLCTFRKHHIDINAQDGVPFSPFLVNSLSLLLCWHSKLFTIAVEDVFLFVNAVFIPLFSQKHPCLSVPHTDHNCREHSQYFWTKWTETVPYLLQRPDLPRPLQQKCSNRLCMIKRQLMHSDWSRTSDSEASADMVNSMYT